MTKQRSYKCRGTYTKTVMIQMINWENNGANDVKRVGRRQKYSSKELKQIDENRNEGEWNYAEWE